MAKWPYEQYYPLEFERDTAGLSMCAKGVWISILNNMWPEDIPTISGSLSFWCRLLRCMPEEFELAVIELSQSHGNNPVADIIYQDKKTGKFITALPKCKDVQGFGNNIVSITCRRIKRRVELKENNKIYMQRYRQENPCKDTVKDNVEFSKGVESESESELKNKTKEKQAKESQKKDGFTLPSWIDKTAWKEFVIMRKKIKKPLTDYAAKLKIKKLEQLQSEGNNHIEVLNRSIESDWHDIYSLQDKDNGSGKPKHEASRLGKANTDKQTETKITLEQYTKDMQIKLDDPTWQPPEKLKQMVDTAGKITVINY